MVGKEGKGNEDAAVAWKELGQLGPDALPAILAATNQASPSAANWLRAAVDAIAERTLAAGKPLPAKALEAFVRDRKNAGHVRRLAYEWLVRSDAAAPGRLLPTMLDDPGAELRRDAIAVKLAEAEKLLEKKDKEGAVAAFRSLLTVARDRDQVTGIAKHLKDLGVEIDQTRHFGFITEWTIIGPFENKDGVGFAKSYPPDQAIDLTTAPPGKGGKPVRWQALSTKAALGLVDFNEALGRLKGATAYALAVVDSPSEQPVELRAGSNNAIRIYLNGKEVCSREEYHHGMRMDQHAGKGVLRKGRNEILVKVCQNEQTESWAQLWSFQLRVCDAIGGAVPVTVVRAKLETNGKGGE
jgi:hypothetical protein